MGPDGARCGKLLRRGRSVGGFVEEMSGFWGEGDGDDLGHAVADGIGFGIVVVEMGEEGGENGAGFFAGALVDVVLGAGGRGGEIGGPSPGVAAVLAEVVVIFLDDAEGGEGLGGVVGSEGVGQVCRGPGRAGLGSLGFGGLAEFRGLGGEGFAEGLEHVGEGGDFGEVADEDVGVAGIDEFLEIGQGVEAGEGAADFVKGVFRKIGGVGGFLPGETFDGGQVVLVGLVHQFFGPGGGGAAFGEAVEGRFLLGNEVVGEGVEDFCGGVEVSLLEEFHGGLELHVLGDDGLGFPDGSRGAEESFLVFQVVEGFLETAGGDEGINLFLDAAAVAFLQSIEEEFRLGEVGVEGDGLGEEPGGAEVVGAVGDEAPGFVEEERSLGVLVAHFLEGRIGDGGQDGDGVLGRGFRRGGFGVEEEAEDEDGEGDGAKGDAGDGEEAGAAGGAIGGLDVGAEGNAAGGEDVLVLEDAAEDAGAAQGDSVDGGKVADGNEAALPGEFGVLGRDGGGFEPDVGGGSAADDQAAACAGEGPGIGGGIAGLGVEAGDFHGVGRSSVLLQGIGLAEALLGEGYGFGIEGEGQLGEKLGLGDGFGRIALAEGDFKIAAGF